MSTAQVIEVSSAQVPAEKRDPISMTRVVLAAGVGIIVENYDFALYGYFAVIIAANFFPAGNPGAALLSTLAIYAAGFVARPLGGIFLGHIGDVFGRKRALFYSILIGTASTVLIGILPNYATIGIAAPILLLVARLGQSFGVAAEYAGAAAYVVEFAPREKRGRFAAVAPTAVGIGFTLGAIVAILTVRVWGAGADGWGWRIPFLAALPIGIIGFYIRSKLGDSEVFEKIKQARKIDPTPLKDAFRLHGRSLLILFGWSILNSVGFFVMAAYLQIYMITVGKFTPQAAELVFFCTIVVFCVATVSVGFLSEHLTRRTLAFGAAIAFGLWAVPTFALMQTGNIILAAIGQAGFAALLPCVIISSILAFVDLFPPAVRASGATFSYNMAQTIFGGTAPYVCTSLTLYYGVDAVGYYVIAAAIVAGLCVFGFVSGADARGVKE
jgi:MHS family proline/betaine transporter-like MFS transporter